MLNANIPAGWQLVPAAPSVDMEIAFAEVWYSKRRAFDDCEMADCYSAMLAAAPEAPALNPWPRLEKAALVGNGRFHAGVSSRLVVEAAQRWHEYEVTPSKEAERIKRGAQKLEQLLVLASAPPQPAAYAVFADNGNIRIWSRDCEAVGIKVMQEEGRQAVPLYTHADTGEVERLRKAYVAAGEREHSLRTQLAEANDLLKKLADMDVSAIDLDYDHWQYLLGEVSLQLSASAEQLVSAHDLVSKEAV